MESMDLLKEEQWHPLFDFGLQHHFFSVNAHTLINTWILIGIILIAVIPVRRILKNPHSILRHLIIQSVYSFAQMVEQSLGTFSYRHFCFITALFIFIAGANIMMVIPFLEEPTKDLNTTLALGIISFLYIQINAIRAHGVVEYLKEYFTPFFVMFPLHVISKLATVVSISFRLFGNIFGGATISQVYFNAIKGSVFLETFGIISGINLTIALFFGIFEGFLQAFVFTMLALTYLSIALQEQEVDHAKD